MTSKKIVKRLPDKIKPAEKKSRRLSSFPPPSDETTDQIANIHKKIQSSSALNGGFEAVSSMVKKIERDQEKLVETVQDIHNVIFHPDDGLFARVKDVETMKDRLAEISIIEDAVDKLQQRVDIGEKDITRDRKTIEDNDKVTKVHVEQLKELNRLKDRFDVIWKWVLLAIAGGATTMVGKVVYGLLNNHVQFR